MSTDPDVFEYVEPRSRLRAADPDALAGAGGSDSDGGLPEGFIDEEIDSDDEATGLGAGGNIDDDSDGDSDIGASASDSEGFGGDDDDNDDDGDEAGGSHAQLLSDVLDATGTSDIAAASAQRTSSADALVMNSERSDSTFQVRGSESDRLSVKDLAGFITDEKTRNIVDKVRQRSAADPALPTLAQQELTRKAGYSMTKEEITKWQDIVKKNREEPHLSFPQNEPKRLGVTTASLSATFTPQTEMEREFAKVLEQGGMDEKSLASYEDLAMNKLSVEEAAARRAELAKMRSLMFYQEQKAKRAKKIKSKAYRKVQKKAEEKRKAAEMSQLMAEDPEAAMELQRQREEKRVRERMTQKHRNTGKWVKHQLARGQMESGTRDAVQEQLRIGDELRRKMDLPSDDSDATSSSGSDSDADDEAAGGAEARILRRAKRKLADMQEQVDGADAADEQTTGLHALKFMKRGAERQRVAAQEMLVELQQDLEAQITGRPLDEVVADAAAAQASGNAARLTFGGKNSSLGPVPVLPQPALLPDSKKARRPAVADARGSGSSKDNAARSTGAVESAAAEDSSVTASVATAKAQRDEDNPWMTRETGRKKSRRKRQRDGSDAEADADEDRVAPGLVAGADADASVAEPAVDLSKQRNLVKEAFAGDDVVAEFSEEKQAAIEADVPEEDDGTMPGWGTWSGAGVVGEEKRKRRKAEQAAKRRKLAVEEAQGKRKDAKLKHVIINEKRDKKSAAYQLASVPFPYQSREQYERANRQPIGKEWNTARAFAKATRPAVEVKAGVLIEPMKKSIRQRKAEASS